MTTRDAYLLLEPAHFLKDKDLVLPLTPEDVETRRRIVDFIHEIDTARFMLAMSLNRRDRCLICFQTDYNNRNNNGDIIMIWQTK